MATSVLRAVHPFGSADSGADQLTRRLRNHSPFIFVRYGDGAVECMKFQQGVTCDGERYTPALARDLRKAWYMLFQRSSSIIGHWHSASFDPNTPHDHSRSDYTILLQDGIRAGGWTPLYIHFESLLLMRVSDVLIDFYRTVRKDLRRKLLIGPQCWEPAAKMLNADFFGLPVVGNLHEHCGVIETALENIPFDVLLYGAGMAGNIPVIKHWAQNSNRTYINLGSALDPLYRGKTRQQQISQAEAMALFGAVCQA